MSEIFPMAVFLFSNLFRNYGVIFQDKWEFLFCNLLYFMEFVLYKIWIAPLSTYFPTIILNIIDKIFRSHVFLNFLNLTIRRKINNVFYSIKNLWLILKHLHNICVVSTTKFIIK